MSEPVQWECPDCGHRDGTAFGSVSFVCPACGFEALGDDLPKTYRAVKEGLYGQPSFAELNRPAFHRDSVPESVMVQLRRVCPFLGTFNHWSDLTRLDVLWILKAAPDAIDILPLPAIKRTDWEAMGKVADGPVAAFASALGKGKANTAVSLIRNAPATDLQRQERLLASFGWSHWADSERNKIAHCLLDAVLKKLGKESIRAFSPETQLNLWRTDPVRSGIDIVPLIPSLPPGDIVFAIGRNIVKADVLDSLTLDRWTAKDWLALLLIPGLTLPVKVKTEIESRWNEFGWSAETLADLIEKNPNARRVFPVLTSEITADLLLRRPQFASWMVSDGWFDRIMTQDWIRVLSNADVLGKSEVLDYARRSVLPSLSVPNRDRLIKNNLDIAALYPLETLSEETVVNLYITDRHDARFAGFDFLSLTRSSWISLLSRCDERIPPATSVFFLKEGGGLDSAAVECLLTGNPALLPFFSKKQISRISTETFLRLCKRSGAPDFLVSAYSVKTWTRKSQEEFLARYPWTGKFFDWTSWPVWVIDRITKNNQMLAHSYPHPVVLFIYRHWKWFTGLVAAILISFGICITSPNLRDMYLSHERVVTAKAAAGEQASKAKISENERLQAEAEARQKDAEARKAKSDEERAKVEAEKAKAEAINAAVRKAEAEALTAKANAEKAKAEKQIKALETQKAKANKSTAYTILWTVVVIAGVIVFIRLKNE